MFTREPQTLDFLQARFVHSIMKERKKSYNYDTKCQLSHMTSAVSCLAENSKNVQRHTYYKQRSHGLYVE